MPFSSSTKSWAVSNKDQRRECIAHAAFNCLYGLPESLKGYVKDVQRKLLIKLREIHDGIKYGRELSDNEKALLLLESNITNLSPDISGLKQVEAMFPVIRHFQIVEPVGKLGRKEVETFLSEHKLSKIAEAMNHFTWTGSSSKAPVGKAESVIGLADDFLEKLLTTSGGGARLTSWLRASDEQWKKIVDAEIERREKQLKYLKSSDPKSSHIQVLEAEIAKLRRDWAL